MNEIAAINFLKQKISDYESFGHMMEDTSLELKYHKDIENLKNIISIVENVIKETENKGQISDGYHTFDELYFHRMILFSVICNQNRMKAWKSRKHHDGTMYDNYFIVGIETKQGQYSYHYHMENWDHFRVEELEFAPVWDGHKPEDITRLLTLAAKPPKFNQKQEDIYMAKRIDSAEWVKGLYNVAVKDGHGHHFIYVRELDKSFEIDWKTASLITEEDR